MSPVTTENQAVVHFAALLHTEITGNNGSTSFCLSGALRAPAFLSRIIRILSSSFILFFLSIKYISYTLYN